MSARTSMYMVFSFVAIVAILSAMYAMLGSLAAAVPQPFHRAALISFLILTLCIETRVRMGFKLPRGLLFASHMLAAIPFFLLLCALSFLTLPHWLTYLAFVLFCATLGTGAVLFSHGMRVHAPVILMKK